MKIDELHPGNCCEWSVRAGIAHLVKHWTRNLSMMQGTLLPESAFSADCLTVFVQPRCAIVCINVCAALKIPNPLSSRWSIVWYPWLCPHWETETDTRRQRQVDRVLRSLRHASKNCSSKFIPQAYMCVIFGQAIHPAMKREFPSSSMDPMKFFVSRVKSNLHIILCLQPSHELLRDAYK